MKILTFLFAFCIMAVSAIAAAHATDITSAQGEKYYQGCVGRPDPRLLPGTQAPWCKCTEDHMMKSMTFEDLQAAVGKNERPAVNKMLVGVYAPCLEFSEHDRIYQECQKQQGTTAAMCQCLASNLAKYTATETQSKIGGVLQSTPNAFDPFAAIRQTPEFDQQSKVIATQCANGTLK